MSLAVKVEGIGKHYRLGEFSRRTFFTDWTRKLLGREKQNDSANSFWALQDVSFDVPQGQVLAIIGHNGAGKSTLLKILSSITAPTCGSIKLRGRVASLLEVGTGFHQELTGRDNIFLNGAILGMSTREVSAKFDDIVGFSEIGEFIDTPVKRYSSGMRVRLAFAVAAHLEPEILIIDEVLAVGDAAFQQRCIGKMGEVSQSGRTVLFVSHNAAAIEKLCTRGLVLEHGRVIFDGTQSEALRNYSNRHSTRDTSLQGRSDRVGSGEVKATEIKFRDSTGQWTQAVGSGEALDVCLAYERHNAEDYTRLCCEITVSTHLGVPVFCHSNWFTGESFGVLPKSGMLVCRLPKLNLPKGNYKVDFGIFPVQRRRAPLDSIKNAAELTVLDSDYYGGGKVPAITDGLCLMPGSWRVESSENKDH